MGQVGRDHSGSSGPTPYSSTVISQHIEHGFIQMVFSISSEADLIISLGNLFQFCHPHSKEPLPHFQVELHVHQDLPVVSYLISGTSEKSLT